ncbi:unnamed protein product [Dovyalis caffra]|uniref:Uncharacterized protein n=1 Tax=Dovyalis caffra TaxID=77055 RepID=A0AAV1SS52_9ROSI|nr:unnamed protein product [Dovyalis caffra]
MSVHLASDLKSHPDYMVAIYAKKFYERLNNQTSIAKLAGILDIWELGLAFRIFPRSQTQSIHMRSDDDVLNLMGESDVIRYRNGKLPQTGSARIRCSSKRVLFVGDFGTKGDGLSNDTEFCHHFELII